jgi:hypothetical protein
MAALVAAIPVGKARALSDRDGRHKACHDTKYRCFGLLRSKRSML